MRVAALNDIHGNLPALEAVLAEVEQENVDAIVCGGDVVAGPFPAEVFDLLIGLPGIRFLRGNADRLVVDGVGEYDHDWIADRERLGARRLAELASWPLTVDLEIDGVGRTLFCHAIPSADEPIFARVTPDADVVELLGEVSAELLVCGHTHVQFDRTLPTGLRIANAGSVGMPYEGRQGAFWALLGPTVELRHTEYDVEQAIARMRAVEPAPEELIGWLRDPPDPDEISQLFEDQRSAPSGA